MCFQGEPFPLESHYSLRNCWQIFADLAGAREKAKQRGETIETVGERTPDQDEAAGTDYTAELAGTGLTIAHVMEDMREPHNIAGMIAKREFLCRSCYVGNPIEALIQSGGQHGSRWLDTDDVGSQKAGQ